MTREEACTLALDSLTDADIFDVAGQPEGHRLERLYRICDAILTFRAWDEDTAEERAEAFNDAEAEHRLERRRARGY